MKPETVYLRTYSSPLGPMVLACTDHGLTGVWFRDAKHIQIPAHASEDPEHPVLMQTVWWLDCYFQGAIPTDSPPFVLSSTPFRIEVWKILQTIPYGETRTYGELAEQIARQRGIPRMSAQAIGGAVSRNPISILIPCHRVIGADHSLTGYDGGLDKKEGLLKLEGILPQTYSCSCF